MAKTNAIAVQDSTEITQKSDKSAETPTTPAASYIGGTIKDDTPPWETPASDSHAPNVADDKVVASSNIIEGVFGEKRAAAVETENQAVEEEKAAQATSAPNKQAPIKKERVDRPPKDKPTQKPEAEKPQKANRAPRLPKSPKEEKQAVDVGGGISGQNEAPPSPVTSEPLTTPKDATRPGETETIIYIAHAELFPFNNHPFQVRNDDDMKSLIASVKERGVDQPAIVRPRENGGFEIVAGHRRQQASELAGYLNVPCVVRNLTDDEAVLMMAESNFNQRAEILPSERAKALKMQLGTVDK